MVALTCAKELILPTESDFDAKPFLRWAGGKTWFKKECYKFFPESFNNYHEPFLGGGSIFFSLKSKKRAFLSDLNSGLINSYLQLKKNPLEVMEFLTGYENTKETFYKIRNMRPICSIEAAAQFIYLNRTCFNGIYRENLNGKFNVPYGNKTYKELFDFDNLIDVSECLQNATLEAQDFWRALENIKEGDFVFLDPPYTVAHENNGFVKYNQKIFSWDDQLRLADFVLEIKKRGAYYVLTNAAHESIQTVFSRVGMIYSISRHCGVGGKQSTRKKINEYIITNIEQKT